jgi:hypothetical protein
MPNLQNAPDQTVVYHIKVEGHLRVQWAEWFEGLHITLEPDGTTLLSGPVIDQAALYSLLKKVRDTGLTLIAVNQIPSKQEPS